MKAVFRLTYALPEIPGRERTRTLSTHFAVASNQKFENAAHGRRRQSILSVAKPTLDAQANDDAVVTERCASTEAAAWNSKFHFRFLRESRSSS